MKASLVLLCVLLAGCVTTRFSNSYTREDGTVSTTKWLAISSAWPGGKLDTSNQTMETTFGGGHMATGQAAMGMDNTGMNAAFQAILELVKRVPTTAFVP